MDTQNRHCEERSDVAISCSNNKLLRLLRQNLQFFLVMTTWYTGNARSRNDKI
ncbi:MAG: hypothetical protein AB8U97_04600 [Rickettsia endosymbiont of Haemaphysalis japonica]